VDDARRDDDRTIRNRYLHVESIGETGVHGATFRGFVHRIEQTTRSAAHAASIIVLGTSDGIIIRTVTGWAIELFRQVELTGKGPFAKEDVVTFVLFLQLLVDTFQIDELRLEEKKGILHGGI